MRLLLRQSGIAAIVAVALVAVACGGDDDHNEETNPTTSASTSTISTNAPTAVPTGSPGLSPTQKPATPAPTSTPTATPTPAPPTPTPTPVPTVDNTPLLVIVTSNGGPLGGTASVTIQTKVGGNCSMVFVLPDGTPLNVPGVDPQVADDTGKITWTWALDPAYPTGSAQAQVTCERSRRAAIIEITP